MPFSRTNVLSWPWNITASWFINSCLLTCVAMSQGQKTVRHAQLKCLVLSILKNIWSLCFLPAVKLNPISQFGKLVGKAALFYDSLRANRYLTQGVGLRCCNEAKLIDGVGDHILGSSVLTDDDVAALLVGFEHPDHLVWDVWGRKRKKKRGELSHDWLGLDESMVIVCGGQYCNKCQ